MKILNRIRTEISMFFNVYWPLVTRRRFVRGLTEAIEDGAHQVLRERASGRTMLQQEITRRLEAEEVARGLTEQLGRLTDAMAVASREDPVYAALVDSYTRVDMQPAPFLDGAYIVKVILDERAPQMFGNDDHAAWSFYADVLARKVKSEILNSKFVQRTTSATAQPLSKGVKTP